MNHANLKHLITQQNNYNNKLYYVSPNNKQPDVLILNFWSGAEISSFADSTWTLTIKTDSLTMSALEAINLCTAPNFQLKKHGARKFSVNGEDFLGNKSVICFDAKGGYLYKEGIISATDLADRKKELHALTRRIRKKVQPQLRLLGTQHFQKKEGDKKYYWQHGSAAEIDTLMDLLDGKNVVENLDKLRCVCDMDELFGNGGRWSHPATSEFQPKKIIDKVLRRVSAHKTAILEKYDERRSNTN